MPHSTSSGSFAREPSISRSNAKSVDNNDSGLEKFPDHIDAPSMHASGARSVSPALPKPNGYAIGLNGGAHLNADRWQPRRDMSGKTLRWENGGAPSRGHRHQKSISEAFNTIRERRGSVSQNAHEIADALRAPISPKLIVCRPYYTNPPRIPRADATEPRAFASCGTCRPP